jgi:hypothetical protein
MPLGIEAILTLPLPGYPFIKGFACKGRSSVQFYEAPALRADVSPFPNQACFTEKSGFDGEDIIPNDVACLLAPFEHDKVQFLIDVLPPVHSTNIVPLALIRPTYFLNR